MLEGILYQRDENQWRYLHLRIKNGEIRQDGGHLITAQFHQFDVVAHEFHFATDGHTGFVGLVHGIAQQVAQLHDRLLRLVAVYLRQTGDVVERIEQKVRIDLVLQPSQFCLHLLLPPLTPSHHITDAQGNADSHQAEQ